jgi:hypothetical protein
MLQARRVGPLAAGALAMSGGGGAADVWRPGVGPVGAGAPRGRVVSTHRRAVTLQLHGGALVALLPEGAPIHPWALTVPFDPAALRVGDEVAVPGGILCVGALRVSLDSAERVELRLRARPAAVLPGCAATLARLADSAERARPAGPFGPALRGALGRFRDGGEAGHLVSLVGLGEGLTPSGDDALVGVLAGLDTVRDAWAGAAALRAELCGALVGVLGPGGKPGVPGTAGPTDGGAGISPRMAGPTTGLSAQMLTAAADGLYAEPVLGVLEVLAEPEAAVGCLLAMGHRSGLDTLHGIVAALKRAV